MKLPIRYEYRYVCSFISFLSFTTVAPHNDRFMHAMHGIELGVQNEECAVCIS
jgi:hypothetical protein